MSLIDDGKIKGLCHYYLSFIVKSDCAWDYLQKWSGVVIKKISNYQFVAFLQLEVLNTCHRTIIIKLRSNIKYLDVVILWDFPLTMYHDI